MTIGEFSKLGFVGENDVGCRPTPRHLLKKVDENFSRMSLYKVHVIL